MRIFVLCPTYKRLTKLRFCLWQFLCQNLASNDEIFFVFYDESGTITGIDTAIKDRVFGIYQNGDYVPIPIKYQMLIEFVDKLFGKRTDDIFVMWDDDDLYLPQNLDVHRQALERGVWSKPSRIWTYYGHKLFIDTNTAGRFYSSIAIRREALSKCSWNSLADNWDLRFIACLHHELGDPVDTLTINPNPQFCYMWSNGDWHYSLFCGRKEAVWNLIQNNILASSDVGLAFPDPSSYPIGLTIYHQITFLISHSSSD